MARQGFFSDLQNAKPFEDLYVASDRAAMIYDITAAHAFKDSPFFEFFRKN